MRLIASITWRSLASRPTLALLAVLILAISTTLLYGTYAAGSVANSLRGSLLDELAVEIELNSQSDSLRADIEDKLRQRPDVLTVESLSPREVLSEVEKELGESLSEILTENPFPSVLRVKLRQPSREKLDLFVTVASQWPGVLQAVYPKVLWDRLDSWIATLRGRAVVLIGAFALLGWTLAGLALRAILRNRRQAWQLLSLLGIRTRDLETAQLLIEIVLGIVAGLIAATLIYGLIKLAGWMLIAEIQTPANWFWGCMGSAVLLSVLSGIWAPRPARD